MPKLQLGLVEFDGVALLLGEDEPVYVGVSDKVFESELVTNALPDKLGSCVSLGDEESEGENDSCCVSDAVLEGDTECDDDSDEVSVGDAVVEGVADTDAEGE